MQIVLPPEVEALVQRQLTSGKYHSAIEVILAGIKLLEQQQNIHQELQQNALEEAYRQASHEVDPTWEVTIADGLIDETW